MIEKFIIINNQGQVCTYKDFKYIYNSVAYDSLWDADFKGGFKNTPGVSYYYVEWTYQDEVMQLKIIGPYPNFTIDPISRLFIIEGQNLTLKLKSSNVILYEIGELNHYSSCYFLEHSGEVNHQLVLPEYVYYQDKRLPWRTFLPTDDRSRMKAYKFRVEMYIEMEFFQDRNSLVGTYSYSGDSYQKREYDAINREWGHIVTAGRGA